MGAWEQFRYTAATLAMALLVGCDINTNKPITRGRSTATAINGTGGTGSGGITAANTITISWNPNRETLVNTVGGGYRVYYSTTTPVPVGAPFVDVPYVTGSFAPTSADIAGLPSGTYYLVVVAYSAQNASGNTSVQTSAVVQ
jgi:hypothetical protein